MQLCKKCGSLMLPKKVKNVVKFICPKCKTNVVSREKELKLKQSIEKDPMDVIPVFEKRAEALPKIKMECPECGHNEAAWWTRQTRSSDEPETRFYKCMKCSYTWREYS